MCLSLINLLALGPEKPTRRTLIPAKPLCFIQNKGPNSSPQTAHTEEFYSSQTTVSFSFQPYGIALSGCTLELGLIWRG